MATSTTSSVKKRENREIKYPEEIFGKERIKTYIVGNGNDDPIVGCINGNNWAVEVNKEVEIPVCIHEIIIQCARTVEESKKESKAFETGEGKKID